jgi:hypothetical protein
VHENDRWQVIAAGSQIMQVPVVQRNGINNYIYSLCFKFFLCFAIRHAKRHTALCQYQPAGKYYTNYHK